MQRLSTHFRRFARTRESSEATRRSVFITSNRRVLSFPCFYIATLDEKTQHMQYMEGLLLDKERQLEAALGNFNPIQRNQTNSL